MLTIKGVVIALSSVKENDRILTVLTHEKGVIDIYARGVRKNTGTNMSASQLFAYSEFSLNERNGRYYLESSRPETIFYGIRNDIKKLALAAYLAEIIKYTVTSEENCGEICRLLLNCFYFLSEGKMECEQIKSIFELRLMSDIGYVPNLIGCNECYLFESDFMYFFYDDGALYCEEHYLSHVSEYTDYIKISKSVLHVIRKICLTKQREVFSFKVKGDTLRTLSVLSEKYLIMKTDHYFGTLDYYKGI